ncbi:hypothetical protein NKG94_15775 [Micromonospora sp. M12]
MPAVTATAWCGPDGTPLRRHATHPHRRCAPLAGGRDDPWLRPDRDDLRERAVAALDASQPSRPP